MACATLPTHALTDVELAQAVLAPNTTLTVRYADLPAARTVADDPVGVGIPARVRLDELRTVADPDACSVVARHVTAGAWEAVALPGGPVVPPPRPGRAAGIGLVLGTLTGFLAGEIAAEAFPRCGGTDHCGAPNPLLVLAGTAGGLLLGPPIGVAVELGR